MSWEIFKQNILLRANRPDAIPDIDTVAKLYATEYDAAVKRGFNTLTPPSSVKVGNVAVMEQFFKLALQKGLTSTQPYDLVGEMGKGVLAYWGTAALNEFPIPLIPAVGTTANISVVSNIVTNPGIWTPPITLPPSEDDEIDGEAESTSRDITVEYAKNLNVFKSLFSSEEDFQNHNKPLESIRQSLQGDEEPYVSIGSSPGDTGTAVETIENFKPNIKIDPDTKRVNTADDKTEKKKQSASSKQASDNKLFALVGNGFWPAAGTPGKWDIDEALTKKNPTAGGCPRYWYVVNRDYMKKNTTIIKVPLSINRTQEIQVHIKFYDILQPLFNKIKKDGLSKYIIDCGGGMAVRNVTCGDRLSHHSWALAIDLNVSLYPYGYNFKDDGLYERINKKDVFVRAYNANDLGFLEIAKIMTAGGCTWLKNSDPMHFSIYE